jgi:hypothetical protein
MYWLWGIAGDFLCDKFSPGVRGEGSSCDQWPAPKKGSRLSVSIWSKFHCNVSGVGVTNRVAIGLGSTVCGVGGLYSSDVDLHLKLTRDLHLTLTQLSCQIMTYDDFHLQISGTPTIVMLSVWSGSCRCHPEGKFQNHTNLTSPIRSDLN